MAKKADLLAEAKKLKLEVNEKNTIAEIEAAIASAPKKKTPEEERAIIASIKKTDEAVVDKEAEEIIEESDSEKTLAKAGKRSAKALKEAEEKQAKEERKALSKTEDEKPKVKHNPPRSRLERRGKNYKKAFEKIDQNKTYALKEAISLALSTASTKFDSTVEIHFRLGVDPKHADQNIRDMVTLPAGTGKTVRVAVFADVEDVAKAKKAGAEIAGNEEFLTQLDKGVIDFDVLIAPPTMMPKLGKYARVLGPKGLMPNPKSGTVSNDIERAVKEAKSGRVEYRVDNTGNVHLGVGKVSFGADKVEQNVNAVIASIKTAKPAGLKGSYIQAVYLTTSMGPSVKVDTSAVS